jgi:hypothetical protein
MPSCESCLDLNGRPSAAGLRQGLALLGVGELYGLPAVELYRCVACGTSFSRVLVGEGGDCVWRCLDCPTANHS